MGVRSAKNNESALFENNTNRPKEGLLGPTVCTEIRIVKSAEFLKVQILRFDTFFGFDTKVLNRHSTVL